MKILGLYKNNCAIELFQWLRNEGHEVVQEMERLNPVWCMKQKFDLTVSYTYRYILTEELLNSLGNNVVNIHNSFLPWNRGADPNLWSIRTQSPRGVSLHYMNSALDKGAIIAQELVVPDMNATLHESYYQLDRAAKEMFMKAFQYYSFWPEMKKTCLGAGSYHSLTEGEEMKTVIPSYDMLCDEFITKVNNI